MKAEPGSPLKGQVAAYYVLRTGRLWEDEKPAVGKGATAVVLLGTDLRCWGEKKLVLMYLVLLH